MQVDPIGPPIHNTVLAIHANRLAHVNADGSVQVWKFDPDRSLE